MDHHGIHLVAGSRDGDRPRRTHDDLCRHRRRRPENDRWRHDLGGRELRPHRPRRTRAGRSPHVGQHPLCRHDRRRLRDEQRRDFVVGARHGAVEHRRASASPRHPLEPRSSLGGFHGRPRPPESRVLLLERRLERPLLSRRTRARPRPQRDHLRRDLRRRRVPAGNVLLDLVRDEHRPAGPPGHLARLGPARCGHALRGHAGPRRPDDHDSPVRVWRWHAAGRRAVRRRQHDQRRLLLGHLRDRGIGHDLSRSGRGLRRRGDVQRRFRNLPGRHPRGCGHDLPYRGRRLRRGRVLRRIG